MFQGGTSAIHLAIHGVAIFCMHVEKKFIIVVHITARDQFLRYIPATIRNNPNFDRPLFPAGEYVFDCRFLLAGISGNK